MLFAAACLRALAINTHCITDMSHFRSPEIWKLGRGDKPSHSSMIFLAPSKAQASFTPLRTWLVPIELFHSL